MIAPVHHQVQILKSGSREVFTVCACACTERERGGGVKTNPLELLHVSTMVSLHSLCLVSLNESLGACVWILLTEKQMKRQIKAMLQQFQGNFFVISMFDVIGNR